MWLIAFMAGCIVPLFIMAGIHYWRTVGKIQRKPYDTAKRLISKVTQKYLTPEWTLFSIQNSPSP